MEGGQDELAAAAECWAADERRHAALRIDRAILRRMLLAAILGQMDENLFGGDAFQVERDAQPIGGGRAEVGVKFHDGSRQDDGPASRGY